MKSAYEIAMEKMNASSGPQRTLSEEQKARIAEIDSTYEARIAEAQMTFDENLAAAPPEEHAALQAERAAELVRLEEKREHDKEAVWGETPG